MVGKQKLKSFDKEPLGYKVRKGLIQETLPTLEKIEAEYVQKVIYLKNLFLIFKKNIK